MAEDKTTHEDELPPPEVTPLDSVATGVDRRRNLRRLPELGRIAFRVVWASARRLLLASFALQVLAALLLGAQLWLVKDLVTGLIAVAGPGADDVERVLPAFVGLLAITALSGVVTAALELLQRMIGELAARHTIDELVEVAATVELSNFEDPAFYDQLQRARAAAGFRPAQMVGAFMALALGLVTSLGVVAALLALEPLLVPLVAVAAVPILLATLRNSREAYVFEYGMTTHARERVHMLELLTERDPAKEVRVFGAAPFLRRRYDRLSDERIAKAAEFLRARFSVSVIGVLASAAGTAIALGALVWLLATDRTTIATAATAVVAMQVLAGRLSTVTGSIGTLVESSLFLEDLDAFLELGARGSAAAPAAAAHAPPFESLRVHGLTFAYPGTEREVLKDVSLEVRRGEVVALVGENGSGKTTLVKLLCQLYRHEHGDVLWNGRDVRELDREGLRATMTVLFQDFVRYQLTVAENIGLGRADGPFDRAAIEAAAQKAGADGIAARLPRGYDQRLGREFHGGAELSGGQWQRLALARAFYRGGDVLVMDEPTAALDPRAEARLFEQVRELAAGRSVLLISHRFSSVRMADRIYVLDGGRVAEAGSHAELMARDGLYADLFRLQAAAYLDGEPAR